MPEQIGAPGIYRDFDIASYHADPTPQPSFTQGIAKLLLARSPAHARLAHPRLCPQPAEDEEEKYHRGKAIGAAAHRLLLGRGHAIAECSFDSWRKDAAKAARVKAEALGQLPILSHDLRAAEALVAAAAEQLPDEDGAPLTDGEAELVLAWQEDGLWCRTMIDWAAPGLCTLWDLKTTSRSAAPHALPLLMAEAGWDVQAAMHARGLDALDPANAGRRRFRFVAIENEPPYGLTVAELGADVLAIGARKLNHAFGIWRECMRRGEWPAYPAAIVYPELPAWHEARWLEREIAFEAQGRMPAAPRSDGRSPDHLMAG